MQPNHTRISKFLSLILRHEPHKFGLALDPNGWASIADVLAVCQRAGIPVTEAILQQVVTENNKQRFAIGADGQHIRANQGHSISIDLQLTPQSPPTQLYHGTARRFLESIRTQGLLSRSRQHVHLSADVETARTVGKRHEEPIVLTVNSKQMVVDGYVFFRSENGVWLADLVPPQYLVFPDPPIAPKQDGY
ncbi:MAG TPA: RNA 2'-phosphotransferase [Anaerolineales bacterium]|nr:RNA 2'-phosphotransferase [Anaerolineales bacterium]